MSTLYVVAMPIGNLEDLTPRARQVLGDVDMIAAEDTRRTGQLLSRIGVEADLTQLHDHNETASTERLLRLLHDGRRIAVVSDAGTPLISDPGYPLVRACHEQGIPVVPVVGASSVAAALSVAGLPTDRFSFEGFLPAKQKARETRLAVLKHHTATSVFFEAPHRIRQCVQSIVDVIGGERELSVCRELTKTYEQIITAPAARVLDRLVSGAIPAKGEFVLVLRGSESSQSTTDADQLLGILLEELSPSRAAAVAARVTGQPRSELYERAMRLKK